LNAEAHILVSAIRVHVKVCGLAEVGPKAAVQIKNIIRTAPVESGP
jgi:hypothetical protein